MECVGGPELHKARQQNTGRWTMAQRHQIREKWPEASTLKQLDTTLPHLQGLVVVRQLVVWVDVCL